MPRGARKAPGGMVFHCLNRGNDRRELFADEADYAAFERVLEQAAEIVPMRYSPTASCPITGTLCCGRGLTGTWPGSCTVPKRGSETEKTG